MADGRRFTEVDGQLMFLRDDYSVRFADVFTVKVGAVSGAEPIPAVRALKKRSVKNPQELKEKILIFEAGLDDAAVELVKNAIVTVVRKNLDGNVHAYFCAATEEELRFALFVKGRQEPVYQTTKMAVYRQSQEVLRTLDYKSPDDFAVVNSKLAQSLLDEYKSI